MRCIIENNYGINTVLILLRGNKMPGNVFFTKNETPIEL
jgi:hypothetical protein